MSKLPVLCPKCDVILAEYEEGKGLFLHKNLANWYPEYKNSNRIELRCHCNDRKIWQLREGEKVQAVVQNYGKTADSVVAGEFVPEKKSIADIIRDTKSISEIIDKTKLPGPALIPPQKTSKPLSWLNELSPGSNQPYYFSTDEELAKELKSLATAIECGCLLNSEIVAIKQAIIAWRTPKVSNPNLETIEKAFHNVINKSEGYTVFSVKSNKPNTLPGKYSFSERLDGYERTYTFQTLEEMKAFIKDNVLAQKEFLKQ